MSISVPKYLRKFETMRKDLYVEVLKCSRRLRITSALHVLWQPYVFCNSSHSLFDDSNSFIR